MISESNQDDQGVISASSPNAFRANGLRSNPGGQNKTHKITLVDLVENINTDVKSEVADFDFEISSKPQVLSYFEKKIA